METKDPEGAHQPNDPAKQRKRHRSSSTSSVLEPAVLDYVIDRDDENFQQDYTSRNHGRHAMRSNQERHRERPSSESGKSSESEATLVQGPRSYERRPRHKTKEDKYELKHGNERKRPEKQKSSSRRQSRNAKTGATLLHNFTAENVASKRLTVCSVTQLHSMRRPLAHMILTDFLKLRPTSKLGLFAKGRASTAVTRKGCEFSHRCILCET